MELDTERITSLASLPSDFWSEMACHLVMQDLCHLVWTGCKALSSTFKRAYFRELHVESVACTSLESTSITKLSQKMNLFTQWRSQKLVLGFIPSAQVVFVVGLLVRNLETEDTSKQDIYNGHLYDAPPWMKNWRRTTRVVLERDKDPTNTVVNVTSLTMHMSSGGFAHFEDINIWKDDLSFQDWTPESVAEQQMKFAQQARLWRYGQEGNWVTFPTEDFLGELITLRHLTLDAPWMPHFENSHARLVGEWFFDLTCLPALESLQFRFSSTPHERRTGITVVSGSTLTKLTILHVPVEASYGEEEWWGYYVDTTGMPNLRSLDMTTVHWEEYWRYHKASHSSTLEELRLADCDVTDDAWKHEWPPKLRSLTLSGVSITHIGLSHNSDQWKSAHMDMTHDNMKRHVFDPHNLPASLETLRISGSREAHPFNPTAADVAEWLQDTESIARRPEPFSRLSLDADIYSRSPSSPSLCFNKATLRDIRLPCQRLTTLDVDACFYVDALSSLPSSLTSVRMDATRSGSIFDTESSEVPFLLTFPAAESFIKVDPSPNAYWPSLQAHFAQKLNWKHLVPLQAPFDTLVADDADGSAGARVDLHRWILVTIMISMGLDASAIPRDKAMLIDAVERHWKRYSGPNQRKCEKFVPLLQLPSSITTLTANPAKDSSLLLTSEIALPVLKSEEKDLQVDDLGSEKRSLYLDTIDADLARIPLPGFEGNLLEWDWRGMSRQLVRLELRSISVKEFHAIQRFPFEQLTSLLVTIRTNTADKIRGNITPPAAPLKELVVYAPAAKINFSPRPGKDNVTCGLERLISCKTFTEDEIEDWSTCSGLKFMAAVSFIEVNRNASHAADRDRLLAWLSSEVDFETSDIPEQVHLLIVNGKILKSPYLLPVPNADRKAINRERSARSAADPPPAYS